MELRQSVNISLEEIPKGVYISGDTATIHKLADGSLIPSGSFTVVGIGVGIDIATFDFSVDGAAFVPILPAGVTFADDIVTINPPAVTFKTLSIRASAEDTAYRAVFTITVTEDGGSPITIDFSIQTLLIPVINNTPNLSTSAFNFIVKQGANMLQYLKPPYVAANTYSVQVISATGVTGFSLPSGDITGEVSVPAITGLSLDIANVELQFIIWDSKLNQHVINKTITYRKVRDGNDGPGNQSIYSPGNTYPSTPTGDNPEGWQTYPLEPTASQLYVFVSTRTRPIGGVWSAWSSPVMYLKYVTDGENGVDGNSFLVRFKRTMDKPATPSQGDLFPEGWHDRPDYTVENDAVLEPYIEGDWAKQVDGYFMSKPLLDEFGVPITPSSTICRLNFKTNKANAQVKVYLKSSSEFGYDFLYAGQLDQVFSTSNYKKRISGEATDIATYTVANIGLHYIELVYMKDASASAGTDAGYFKIDSYVGKIWRTTCAITGGVASAWSDPDIYADTTQKQVVPYPAGKYLQDVTYTRTELAAPFVEYGNYVYILDKIGSFTNVDPVLDIANSGGIWRLFEKIPYLFADMFVAQFGKIGSGVFKDYKLISQYGVNNDGTIGNRYYEPNFLPNIAIDFLNGLISIGKNWRFGMKDGYGVLEYYDNDGKFLYDLGPNGLKDMEVREASWTKVTDLIYLGTDYTTILTTSAIKTKYKRPLDQTTTTYWRYTSKMVAGVNQDPTNDGKVFVSASLTANKLDGILCMKRTPMIYRDYGTSDYTVPDDLHSSNETFYTSSVYTIYMSQLIPYSSGVRNTGFFNAYWSEKYIPINE